RLPGTVIFARIRRCGMSTCQITLRNSDWCDIAITLIDPANVYVSGVASHFGFVSLPHFLGSSLCIFSIAFAVSGWFSITCFVITWTISFHDAADSFCSHGPPNDRHVIVFMRHLHPLYRCTVGVEGLLA